MLACNSFSCAQGIELLALERSGKKSFSGLHVMYSRPSKALEEALYPPVMPMMTDESTYTG